MKKKIIAGMIVTGLVAGFIFGKRRHIIGSRAGKKCNLLSNP